MRSQRSIQDGFPNLSLLGSADVGLHADAEGAQRRTHPPAEVRHRNHEGVEDTANAVWHSDLVRLDQPPFGLYAGAKILHLKWRARGQ